MSIGVVLDEIDYPTGDGKPMAETPVHRRNMTEAIEVLERWLADRPAVYVSGNMLMYYERGNQHRHVSPDVFVVFDVPRKERDAYFTWTEPKPTLDFVAEFSSKSTAKEDGDTKWNLYKDVLQVREYLLFDPRSEYLTPPQQLFRLVDGQYVPVEPVDGRLPSEVLGLHIDREGEHIRLWDPVTRTYLPTNAELAELARSRADREGHRAESERLRAEGVQQLSESLQQALEASERRAETLQQVVEAGERRAEVLQRMVDSLQRAVDALQRIVNLLQQTAEAAEKRANSLQQVAESAQLRADGEREGADLILQLAETERQNRERLEAENAKLKDQIARLQAQRDSARGASNPPAGD